MCCGVCSSALAAAGCLRAFFRRPDRQRGGYPVCTPGAPVRPLPGLHSRCPRPPFSTLFPFWYWRSHRGPPPSLLQVHCAPRAIRCVGVQKQNSPILIGPVRTVTRSLTTKQDRHSTLVRKMKNARCSVYSAYLRALQQAPLFVCCYLSTLQPTEK